MAEARTSPLADLQRHARDRASAVALVERRGASWLSLTWSELHRRVVDGAAGMLDAGVRPGEAVVLMVPAGIRLAELELAVRAMGAVPLMLPERLGPAEVGRLLEGVDVRLVVVDRQQRLALLRHAALADAQLFECDDDSWGRLRAMGAERRGREPGVLVHADALRDPATTRTVLGLPREKSAAWLFRPDASGATSDLRADDVVVLVGEASDRFTTVVREAHHRSGCALAWVEGPDELAAALAAVRPTHAMLDHTAARALEDLLLTAHVDGVLWHESPLEVLDAAAAVAGEAKVGAKGRRLAAEVARLAPWWGGRLQHLVLDARVDRTVIGLAAALDLHVGRVAHLPAVRLDLRPTAPTPAPAPAPAPTAVAPEPEPSLPRRARGGLDAAFSLAGS